MQNKSCILVSNNNYMESCENIQKHSLFGCNLVEKNTIHMLYLYRNLWFTVFDVLGFCKSNRKIDSNQLLKSSCRDAWSQSYQTFFFIKWRFVSFFVIKMGQFKIQKDFLMLQTLKLNIENWKNKEIKVWYAWLLIVLNIWNKN